MEIGYDAGDRGEPEYPEQETNHVHEWALSEGSGVYCKTHHHRACMMSNAKAIAILNEHAKLERYVEEFHDEDFVLWCREQDALADTQHERS